MARPQSPHPQKPQFSMTLPLYVLIQLRALAVREGCSLRHLVLKALPSLGIHVAAEDLLPDRRSVRGEGNRKHYAQNMNARTK